MAQYPTVMQRVRRAAARRVLFLPHALRQMLRSGSMVSPREVRQVTEMGEVIEDFPDDPRGHSFLPLGRGHGGRPIHVVCAPRDEYLAVITTYVPDGAEWSGGYRQRTT